MMNTPTAYRIPTPNPSGPPITLTRRQMLAMGGAALILAGTGTGPAHAGIDLEVALAPRIYGNPDAPIHIAEYFSMSCGHCANFHLQTFPKLKAEWIDTGKARFEYRDFPLRGPAIYAHALARAVPAEAYENMIDILLRQQQTWASADDPVSSLARIARIAGIGNDAFVEIIQNRPFLEGIVAIAQKGYETWEINSTPSFVINDQEVIRGDKGYDDFVSVLRGFST